MNIMQPEQYAIGAKRQDGKQLHRFRGVACEARNCNTRCKTKITNRIPGADRLPGEANDFTHDPTYEENHEHRSTVPYSFGNAAHQSQADQIEDRSAGPSILNKER
jgi:hypothetical protein